MERTGETELGQAPKAGPSPAPYGVGERKLTDDGNFVILIIRKTFSEPQIRRHTKTKTRRKDKC